MSIKFEYNATDFDTAKKDLAFDGNCTHPAGHCYGSDGGSGIPENLKVPPNRGGEIELWKLNDEKNKVLNKFVYNKCQYCGKIKFSYEKYEEQENRVESI